VTPARAGRAGLALVLVLALMLALASCGGDDEESAATTETQPPPTAEPAPTATEETEAATEETEAEEPEAETEPAEPEPEPAETEAPTSPEDQPGGAGDEEPARSLALFTGEGGRITPRTIRVPAFISIRVELRAEDGREYGLTFDGNTLRVSGGLSSVSTTIDGLRPGEAVVGTPIGAGNRVRIEATAEPGP
jgi:type IV secretory pathway VirB10-like protein